MKRFLKRYEDTMLWPHCLHGRLTLALHIFHKQSGWVGELWNLTNVTLNKKWPSLISSDDEKWALQFLLMLFDLNFSVYLDDLWQIPSKLIRPHPDKWDGYITKTDDIDTWQKSNTCLQCHFDTDDLLVLYTRCTSLWVHVQLNSENYQKIIHIKMYICFKAGSYCFVWLIIVWTNTVLYKCQNAFF